MYIAVYCGAAAGNSEAYTKLTVALGEWIVKHHYNLVYGGGNVGLMGLIADTVLDGKQEVYGIIPDFLVTRELAKTDLTNLETVSTMQERKLRMIEKADVFIALPGGPGTLEEITEVISLGRVGQHQNPCILINHEGYYDHLKAQYANMVEEGFLSQEDFDTVLFANSLDDLDDFIKNYTPPQVRVYK